MKSAEAQEKTHQEFRVYLFSGNVRWFWATIMLAVATTMTVFTVPENSYPLVYLRYVLGIVFVLWLPGYAFIKALFPIQSTTQKSSESLDAIERVALSLGTSLAFTAIVAVFLNLTPWGIRLTPITLSLLTLTVIFALAAILRNYLITTDR